MTITITGIFTLAANDTITVLGNSGSASYSFSSSALKSTLTIIKM